MESTPPSPPARHPISTMSASLAAASLVAITQILTTEPDRALLIAVWLFAFSLPLLVMMGLIAPIKRIAPFPQLTLEETKAFARFLYIVFLNISGFAFVFFHFGTIAGLAFLASCLLAVGLLTQWKAVLPILGFLMVYPVSLFRMESGKIRERVATSWRKIF